MTEKQNHILKINITGMRMIAFVWLYLVPGPAHVHPCQQHVRTSPRRQSWGTIFGGGARRVSSDVSQRHRPVHPGGCTAPTGAGAGSRGSLVVLRVEHVQSAVQARVPRRVPPSPCTGQIHADHVPQVTSRARR